MTSIFTTISAKFMTIDNYFSLNSQQLNRTHNRIILLENNLNHSFTNFYSQMNYQNEKLSKQILQNYTNLRKEIFKELKFLSDKHWFFNSLTFFCFGVLLFIFIIQLFGILFILLKINTTVNANNRRFDYWLCGGNYPIIKTGEKSDNKDASGVNITGAEVKNEVLAASTSDESASKNKASKNSKVNVKNRIAFWQKKSENIDKQIDETTV